MNLLSTAYQYAEDVRSGKIIVGRYARLAVERHYKDLELGSQRGIYFDEKTAQKWLTFFDFLSLSKGDTDGASFKLEGWQSFIIASVYGWKKSSDHKRRFTEAYTEVSKKQGKTTLAAAVGLGCMAFDNENGPEVYAAAYTRDQASICFDEAVAMVQRSPALNKRITRLKYNLTIPSTRAKFNAVSHDAKNTEGKNSHCVLFDEYHVHVSDGVKVSLQSGMAARSQPLFFIITTAGDNKQGPCYKYRDICVNILEGKAAIDNVFVMIHGIDEGDDWKDERVWAKANPNLNVSVRLDFLRGEFKKALLNGRAEVEFKTKHLNMWVDAAVTWIPSETWNALARTELNKQGEIVPFSPPQFAPFYGGLDLGQTNDIASFALYFPDQKYLKVFHYCSEEAVKHAARGGIDYQDWVDEGHLTVTPGKTTDYDYIKKDIEQSATYWQLNMLGMDPWGATQFKQQMEENFGTEWLAEKQKDGTLKYGNYPRAQMYAQVASKMCPPTRIFEEMILNGNITHDGNPITAWMLGNVVLSTDVNGNYRPGKDKSKDKIDGIVASIIALGMYDAWHGGFNSNKGVPAC